MRYNFYVLGLWLYVALLADIGLFRLVSQLRVPCTAPNPVETRFLPYLAFLKRSAVLVQLYIHA